MRKLTIADYALEMGLSVATVRRMIKRHELVVEEEPVRGGFRYLVLVDPVQLHEAPEEPTQEATHERRHERTQPEQADRIAFLEEELRRRDAEIDRLLTLVDQGQRLTLSIAQGSREGSPVELATSSSSHGALVEASTSPSPVRRWIERVRQWLHEL